MIIAVLLWLGGVALTTSVLHSQGVTVLFAGRLNFPPNIDSGALLECRNGTVYFKVANDMGGPINLDDLTILRAESENATPYPIRYQSTRKVLNEGDETTLSMPYCDDLEGKCRYVFEGVQTIFGGEICFRNCGGEYMIAYKCSLTFYR